MKGRAGGILVFKSTLKRQNQNQNSLNLKYCTVVWCRGGEDRPKYKHSPMIGTNGCSAVLDSSSRFTGQWSSNVQVKT